MKLQKMLIILVIFTGILLSACQPTVDPGEPVEEPTDETNVPDPSDVSYEYGERAMVESLEVILLESFPVQAQAVISGNLPDGCTELYETKVEQNGLRFNITLNTRTLTGDIACTEALVPFETTVALDIQGLEPGTYPVIAQDKQTTFTLDVENVLSGEPQGQDFTYGSQAMVESINVSLMESFPVQVNVTLSGSLPDGCTKIYEIKSPLDGQSFNIEIVTRKPVGVACTMALVPFEETISLDVEGLPAGDYTVEVGDLSETFTLEQDNG